LLTPTSLGSAATVPEPTTLAMFGVFGLLLGVKSARVKKSCATPPNFAMMAV
jgi:xanthosine utilization system XapX-like protein